MSYRNGQAALYHYYNPAMEAFGKRKRNADDADEWHSDAADSTSDDMNVDEDDEPLPKRRRGTKSHSALQRPSRAASTRQSSRRRSLPSDDEEDDLPKDEPQPRRSNRAPKPRFMTQDQDELRGGFVSLDIIGPQKTRPRPLRANVRRLARPARQMSPDSDIEFEAPRRSNRATRNQLDMRDDVLMEDDVFYLDEGKSPNFPKVISIREVFQPTDPNSAFGSAHIDSCHSCGGSKQKGQLVCCQGCSLSFHKNCIGYRSAREHMVTKVGDEDFVLQCKYCIGLYRKKDANAPKYDMCQVCKEPGKACAAWSEKKTSRQEAKLREENGGVDPITPVSPDLVNNPELLLFRCMRCHRGWHIEHLPPTGKGSTSTDILSERLKDYSIDWACNDCSSARLKVQRLVAWRPAQGQPPSDSSQAGRPSLADLDEDNKEYLVKWESSSYAHCTWKPSAWVFGITTAAMRKAFAKRDAEKSMLHYTTQDAVPEEYLVPDVILNVKMDGSTFVRSQLKKDELNQISKIKKIYVKFQGLGYDEVVWDTPPKPEGSQAIYDAFVRAYSDYLDGKFFEYVPYPRLRERLREYKTTKFEEVDKQPSGLQRGKLMQYQIEGLNWLLENFHKGTSVVLADEMGLGKTVQVVSLVASLVQDKPNVSHSCN